MSKMDMYLITYMLDQTFDTVGNIIAEACVEALQGTSNCKVVSTIMFNN